MLEPKVEKNPPKEKLEELKVFSWPIWEKEPSKFDWVYDYGEEICYIIEGRVKVYYGDGKVIELEKGDLVTFPEGLQCTWEILEKVKKHYFIK